MNTKKTFVVVSIVAISSLAFLQTGCLTSKQQTVTNGVTNIVTVVNEGNLALDATAAQVATAIAVNTVLVQTKNDPGVISALKNAKTTLDGILGGVTTATSQQVIAMLKLQGNSALSSQVDTLLQAISGVEQKLIDKYGTTTVGGEITVALLKAVDAGLTVGLAGH